jgi:hypothetical protein
MTAVEKYLPIYQDALEKYAEAHPHWRIEVLVSLIKWSLKSLKHYIEDGHDPEITWESPFVELHYPVDWSWKGRAHGEVMSGGYIFGKITPRNMATKKLAVKTLARTMACQFNATMMADATNWAWYKKLNNYYTPILPIGLSGELNAIKIKRQRREYFEEIVRPFSIGAARIDCGGMERKPGTPVPTQAIEKLEEINERMDIRGIRFTGNVNGRKFDMGLVFEIHPLIADYDKGKAYHSVVVGLAVLRAMDENELVGDTPAKWPKSERTKFWDELLRKVEKITNLLIPKNESRESVILSVNSTLKIPVEHWRPENQSAEIKKVADALAKIGELHGLKVETAKDVVENHHQDICPVCGWIHDVGFTQIKPTQDKVITLSGILPDIVAVVHHAHEKDFPALSSKDDELLRICGGYRNACKAFDDLNHRDDYKSLFDTRKRGFISLRGAIGRNRKKSEARPE